MTDPPLTKAERALDRLIPWLVAGLLISSIFFVVGAWDERKKRREADLRVEVMLCEAMNESRAAVREILQRTLKAQAEAGVDINPYVVPWRRIIRTKLQPLDCAVE